jgi:hypothetical protein
MRFFKGNLVDAEDNMPKIRQKTVQDIEKFKETASGNFENFFPTNNPCGPQAPVCHRILNVTHKQRGYTGNV